MNQHGLFHLYLIMEFQDMFFFVLSIKTLNDRQNLIFVEDKHTYGKKMTRKGRTKVIYKGTFVCMYTDFIIVWAPKGQLISKQNC